MFLLHLASETAVIPLDCSKFRHACPQRGCTFFARHSTQLLEFPANRFMCRRSSRGDASTLIVRFKPNPNVVYGRSIGSDPFKRTTTVLLLHPLGLGAQVIGIVYHFVKVKLQGRHVSLPALFRKRPSDTFDLRKFVVVLSFLILEYSLAVDFLSVRDLMDRFRDIRHFKHRV